MTITNNRNIPLELAVWVLFDDYDFIQEDNYASATGLMKPLRHIVLPPRIASGGHVVTDVEDLIPSAMGKAFHSSVQRAWEHGNHRKALQLLGYPMSVVDRVLVNPTPEQLAAVKDPIPVYIEQRAIRTIMVDGVPFKIGGKFDMVCDGRVTDLKSTTVYSWILGTKDDDYRMQMSIYRWLNPDKVTHPDGRINYIFTDWSRLDARRRSDYPRHRLMPKDITLLSMDATEDWIRNKIRLIIQHQNTLENLLPECTDEELWITAPTFKYFSNPTNKKASKNFESFEEAEQYRVEKGKGVVKIVKGTPKRCDYCSAFPICTQKDNYDHD